MGSYQERGGFPATSHQRISGGISARFTTALNPSVSYSSAATTAASDRLTLGLLPRSRPRGFAFLSSFAFQVIVVVLMFNVTFVAVPKLVAPQKQLELTNLVASAPVQRPAVPVSEILPAAPSTVLAPRLVMPQPPQPVDPPAVPTPIRSNVPHLPDPPRIEVKGVRTEVFSSTGSQAVPELARQARTVQTGGFGDPAGVPTQAQAAARPTIANVGSFDLPAGPGTGNGTGGATGARGTVASVGFGTSVATGTTSAQRTAPQQVQQGTFASMQPAGPTNPARTAPQPARTTPVQILFKPSPVYTDEARQLHLEGDVLLQVTFTAGGKCQVNRVLRGLGHGLDEAAVRSAEQIRFQPATEGGHPVDSVATMHVIFRLT